MRPMKETCAMEEGLSKSHTLWNKAYERDFVKTRTLDLPQPTRVNPVQCYSTHQERPIKETYVME